MDTTIYHFEVFYCCRAALRVEESMSAYLCHIMLSILYMLMNYAITAIRSDCTVTLSINCFNITILDYRYIPLGIFYIAVVTYMELSVRRSVCPYAVIVASRQQCPKLSLFSAFCADASRAVGPASGRCRLIGRRRSLSAAGGAAQQPSVVRRRARDAL